MNVENEANDTIVAQATAFGASGVAIVRVSGPDTALIAEKILREVPEPRKAWFGNFRDENSNVIDQGLALYFSKPKSFTGEDVLELHCHGSVAIVNLLQRTIVSLGARLAKPGEFSERAFLNGKIDLAQAEAISDLIAAANEKSARAAMRSLQGEFSKLINSQVEELIKLRTFIEASIDFSDEPISLLENSQITEKLARITNNITQIIKNTEQGVILRNGINVVIVGEPNVGKSTLLNRLSQEDIAIVTNIPGTTRDILKQNIQINGLPVTIIDTAGLRETSDIVEQEGIKRTEREVKKADLVLQIIDAATPFSQSTITHKNVIIVRNKIDLKQEEPKVLQNDNVTIVSISALQNQGLDLLKTAIMRFAGLEENNENIFTARERHLKALSGAQKFLARANELINLNTAPELLAEELRHTQLILSEITGQFSSDDLLGRIFSTFCIGK